MMEESGSNIYCKTTLEGRQVAAAGQIPALLLLNLPNVQLNFRKEDSMKPAGTGWKFFLDFRMLSILLLIAVIPFLLGTWWLVNSYRGSYLESHGSSLAEEAEVAFNYVNNYLGNQIIEIAGLTEVPTLREAIEKNNLELKTGANEIQRKTSAVESRWRNMDYKSAELRAVLDNPASDFLRRYTTVHPSYREIIVTDLMARTVAATGKTSDFQHIRDTWWKDAYSDGHRGAVYVGDVHFHESANVYSFDIAQPFVDPKGGVMGVIMVGIDAQEIHALVGSFRTSFGGAAALVRADGSIISAPGYGFLDKRPFSGISDIINARLRGKSFVITETKPRTIFGVNSRSFVEIYPHLKWILAVSSPVETVVGPLTHLLRNIVMLMLSVILVTFLVALWLSRMETRPILQEDAHLERI
jgi:hypothetical protein